MKCRGSNVRPVTADPRHFIEHTGDAFDLIQLAVLESLAAGSGGIAGLGQDHLATVEGIAACVRRLTPQGILTVTRGIQTPPRDNLKLMAIAAEALRRVGVSATGDHVVIVRDFLAVCTLVKRTPFTPQQIERVRRECRSRNLTPVWFPGVRDEELNQPDALPGPSGAPGDWYHFAAKELFNDTRSDFLDRWPFHIRPATDQSPFFMDFCKLASLAQLRRAFGDLWLTRAELGFVFVLAAIVVITLVGAILTLLPAVWTSHNGRNDWRWTTAAYFAAIGLAYLLLEMTLLSRLTFWIGDPVTAAALTIAGFLCFSGLGSLTAHRALARRDDVALTSRRTTVLLIVIGTLALLLLGPLSTAVGGFSPAVRGLAALGAVAPLAFFMGFPMPLALARLNLAAPAQVPLAWAVNGFASDLAPPLATAIGMTWGFHVAGGLALTLYLLQALLFSRLARQKNGLP